MAEPMSSGTKATIVAALIGAVAVVSAAVIMILPNIDWDGPTPRPSASPMTSASGQETTTPEPTASPTASPTPAVSLSFLERVAGDWTLDSWTESGGPITLYIEVLNGTMSVQGPDDPNAGVVSWRMDIQERNEPTSPQPAILCGGQTTLSQMIEGVPGGQTNSEIDWTADLRSINSSGPDVDAIWLAMCGWATNGTRDPFAVTLSGDDSMPAERMEMTNDDGTFRWSR